MIEIINLTAGYKKGTPILQDFSLWMGPGERLGITGQNGCGKSTLAKAIMGLVPHCSGDILFENKSIFNISAYNRAKMGIAFFMQGGRIYRELSVEENLMWAGIGKKKFSYKKELAELQVPEFPFWKDRHRLTMPAANLSGGERHLLAFFMVLIACPEMKLLIADEPSAGVAPKAQLEILEIMDNSLRIKKTGLLLIEQNVNFLNRLTQNVISIKS
jgi:ABC-type branched-subunit amino acid transport system ATPase component